MSDVLVTPDFSHLISPEYSSVYEPCEDTFLFLDALEAELPFLKSLNPTTVVEIGSGSGVVIAALASLLKGSAVYMSTDINKHACFATFTTSKQNGINVDNFVMDLLTCFKPNIFDVILFNPPYVVTDTHEISGNGIERSWAGGANGREIIDRLLPLIPSLLSKHGVFYLVVIKENKPEQIADIMEKFNYKMKIVKERKIMGEHLYVLKFSV